LFKALQNQNQLVVNRQWPWDPQDERAPPLLISSSTSQWMLALAWMALQKTLFDDCTLQISNPYIISHEHHCPSQSAFALPLAFTEHCEFLASNRMHKLSMPV
jgi:hypothetical protein